MKIKKIEITSSRAPLMGLVIFHLKEPSTSTQSRKVNLFGVYFNLYTLK